MLKSLKIVGFRTFKNLVVEDLNRVNLFVGRNNAGKTGFLEALELWQGASIQAVARILRRRGELLRGRMKERPALPMIGHLFHGRAFAAGAALKITGASDNGDVRSVSLRVVDSDSKLVQYKSDDDDDETMSGLAIEIDETGREKRQLPLTSDWTIPWHYSRMERRESPNNVHFVAAGGVNSHIGELWNDVVLTPREELSVNAVRIIEPTIERIAHAGGAFHGDHAFFVKLQDSEHRLPLGSMGDGVMRLLTLSICLTNSTEGTLLVDEIDTGLHHSTMVSMWKLLVQTASDLNCQVFATTHSLDCVRAIAEFHRQDDTCADRISLWRLESREMGPVRYSADDIAIAADNDMELR